MKLNRPIGAASAGFALLAAHVALGAGVYLAVLWLAGSPELRGLLDRIRSA